MPGIGQLDARTVEVTKECLRAAVEGPFFTDREFQTLIGVERDEVRTVYEAWPRQTVDTMTFCCAVVNSLNNLTGYPHGMEAVWSEYISVGSDEVRMVLDRLIDHGNSPSDRE